MLIAVINESTLISNSDCQTMCQAIQIQLDLHFAPAWGLKPGTIQFFADKTKVPNWAWVVNMLDDSTQAGALGYHSLDGGVVDAFIFAKPVLDNGGSVMVFDPANPNAYTVSATLDHEVLEMYNDRYANLFAVGPQLPQGNLYAFEMADAVENDSYPILVGNTQVAMSNFLFPSWFNDQATVPANMPFDYMKKLTAPYSMTPGGYMLVATISNEGQVMAHVFDPKMPQWRRDMKMSATSRGARRNAK